VLVALTRERGHNEELRHVVAEVAEVAELPLTTTVFRPLDDVAAQINALKHFGDFRSLVVTSARCARYVALVTDALVDGHDVFSVGPSTTAALESAGLSVTGESSTTALDLADVITRSPVVLLAATGGRRELCEELARRHLQPHVVECYSTVDVVLDEGGQELLGRADVVFIGAPSAWRVARRFVSAHAWVLVPGATTLDEVREDHERVLVGWGEDFAHAWRVVVSPDA
jgi:uroporphyrinogen-III synthase